MTDAPPTGGPPCGHDPRLPVCHLCRLYETRADYRELWDRLYGPAADVPPDRDHSGVVGPAGAVRVRLVPGRDGEVAIGLTGAVAGELILGVDRLAVPAGGSVELHLAAADRPVLTITGPSGEAYTLVVTRLD